MPNSNPEKLSEVQPHLASLKDAKADSGASMPSAELEAVLGESPFDRSPTSPCPSCDFRGIKEFDDRGVALYCDCEHGHRKHQQHYERIHDRFDHAGVPDRLRYVTLESLRKSAGESAIESPAVQAVGELLMEDCATCPRFGGAKPGLCVLGANGRGKTGLLVILARQAYRQGYTPLFIKYADLIRGGIQAGYGVYTSEDVELSHIRLQTAQRISHLCLDDLGDPFGEARSFSETKDRRDLLFQVLSARHERGLTTHITANYADLETIGAQFDPRIADRIKEMCAIVQMEGPNLRELT